MNGLLLRSLRSLSAVLGTGLASVRNACGIQSSSDDVVSGTGQILNTAASDQNNAVFLQIVSFAGNVARHFDSVGKTYSGDLSKSGVRLFGGSGLNSGAHASLLRGGSIDRSLVKGVVSSLQSRSGGLLYAGLTSLSH